MYSKYILVHLFFTRIVTKYLFTLDYVVLNIMFIKDSWKKYYGLDKNIKQYKCFLHEK